MALFQTDIVSNVYNKKHWNALRRISLYNIERKNEKGEIEVAVCPLCGLRVEFIGAPMVRCYSTGDTYEPAKIVWTLKSKLPKETGYDVENIRGNDRVQDFLPNANQLNDEIEA